MTDLIPREEGPRRPDRDPERERRTHHFEMADEPPRRAEYDDDTIELKEVVAILRRRMWLVLAFVVLGGAGAGAIHEFQEPRYRATAVIRIDDPRPQMVEGLAALDRSRGRTDPVLSALELLRSHSVLSEIVDREGLRLQSLNHGFRISDLDGVQVGELAGPDTLDLRFGEASMEVASRRSGQRMSVPYGDPVSVGEVRFRVASPPGVAEGRLVVRDRQRAVRSLESGLSSRPRPETNVVDVEFTASDPELAQRVVNQAVRVFRERSTAQARAESFRRRIFLEEQLAQVDSTLQTTQQALSQFRSQEGVISSEQWAASQQSGLMNIEVRREELAADRQMYRQLLDGLMTAEVGEIGDRLQSLIAAPQIAQNPVVADLSSQLIRLEAARDSLVAGPWGLSAQNPDVVRLDQQIETTRGRLRQSVGSHMEAIEARIVALDDLRNRTAARLTTLPETGATEARLLQQVQSVQRTAEQLRDEFYRAQITEAVEEGPVEILDFAPMPLDSERAGLPLMLSLGLMLGLMVGSGLAFLREMLNTRIRREEDLEHSLHVGMVGVIPRLPAPGRKRLSVSSGSAPAGNGKKRRSGNDLITVHDGRSGPAEAFRTLRTNLLFAKGAGELRSLVVTSALPEEGKTTTAANLAVTYAQQGLRVLLVDCDLRKPRIADLFDMPRKPGLTELVLHDAAPGEVIREYPPVEGLWILPSGTLPPNPTELLGGARMRAALEMLRDRFDILILDTPPLAGGADGAILGANVDGVLMVVRAGQTEQDAARLAARQLHTVGARLVGAVLNDPDGETPKYGYQYYYQYKYYGEGEPG